MTDTPDTEQILRGRKKAAEANELIEKQLWKTADKLRKNLAAAFIFNA